MRLSRFGSEAEAPANPAPSRKKMPVESRCYSNLGKHHHEQGVGRLSITDGFTPDAMNEVRSAVIWFA
jgi:hypothetical protein